MLVYELLRDTIVFLPSMERVLPTARLDSQLCFALYSASNHLTSIYRPLLEPLDLTYTQFIVLMALWEQDEVSISQLAKTAGLSKATMTPLLKRLEQKELISRELLEGNERQKNIALTPKGKALGKKSKAVTDKAFCATGLSKQEADTLIALSKKLIA